MENKWLILKKMILILPCIGIAFPGGAYSYSELDT